VAAAHNAVAGVIALGLTEGGGYGVEVGMRDPYEVLGVGREATAEQIRNAYRKLAKTSHPDLHPGDKAAEVRFKEASAAYELLSDEEKRRLFDRGEIDASGAPRMREQFYRDFADAPGGARYPGSGSFENATDLEDIIQDLFGGRAAGGRTVRMRGGDVGYRLEIGLGEVVRGAKVPITLADGSGVEVTIPPGVAPGQVLRLKGKGSPGIGGGPPGDALIEVQVRPHPVFERKGDDLHMALPVTLTEALRGEKVTVPTLHGPVVMTIPRRSTTGTILRLRGKGVPRAESSGAGDQYVRVEVAMPPAVDEGLEQAVADWELRHPHDPRAALMREAGA
jgi:DnaJ-class molecular chaperone